MRYYRVKVTSDCVRTTDSHELVKNELYTEDEMREYNVSRDDVVPVDMDENDTYWMFGARFSNDCGYSDNPFDGDLEPDSFDTSGNGALVDMLNDLMFG